MKRRVLILGSGISGLVAAVHLVRAGFRVTLLEKRPFAGGRTYSFRKPFWPFSIDNGPHVMLGAYTALLDFLKLVGGQHLVRGQKRLRIPYLLPGGKKSELRAAGLPAPLHLAAGLWRFPLLDRPAKLALTRAFFQITRLGDSLQLDEITAADWLKKAEQPELAERIFWRPLVLATLNAEPEQVSFLQLFRVLKLGFLAGKAESRIFTFPAGLTPTLIEPALRWLEKNGGSIYCRRGVQRLQFSGERVTAVETAHGRLKDFGAVISALPAHALADLFRRSSGPGPEWADQIAFTSQPILNLHFWLPEPLLADSFAALVGIRGQWLFRSRERKGQVHHTLVVSGAGQLLTEPRERLIAGLLDELKGIFPKFRRESVQKHYLVIEKRATILSSPGVEALRPPPGKFAGNFFLAGDWTRTGLPPTMESAARSGLMAAEAVLRWQKER